MGLLDFFKRKKVPPPAARPEDEGPSLRYVLAHYALRQFALAKPLQYLGILASPDARSFLCAVVDDVAQQMNRPIDFSLNDIQVHPVRIGDYPCAIVEMPTPIAATEAYFTALVALVNPADGLPADGVPIPARYITLEKGVTIGGPDRTVLAAWDTTSHSNFGSGPEPTVGAFTQAIEGLLK